MTRIPAGARGVAAAALALPLALFLVGSGGGLLFDPTAPLRVLGTPYWVLAIYGLFELGLAGAMFVPYLHRLAGALIAVDALLQAGVNASAGRQGAAVMHLVVAAMGAAIALLWTSERVEAPRLRPAPRHVASA